MALSKIQSESINLADTFAFSGTVTGTSGYTLGTEIDLTSSATFTGIPSGTNWIDVLVRDMSVNSATTDFGLILGISSGFVTSGYLSTAAMVAPSTAIEGHTDRFGLSYNSGSAADFTGIIHCRRMSGNTWIMNSQMGDTHNNQTHWGSGHVTLSGELTQLKLDPDGNAFDDGEMNIAYGS